MPKMTIGEVAQKAGVAASTLRYYESIGILPPAARHNGRRQYEADILKKLAAIQFAKQAGWSLEEIDYFLNEMAHEPRPSQRWHTMAHQKLVELDALIEQIEAMKAMIHQGMACQCDSLQNCDLAHKN